MREKASFRIFFEKFRAPKRKLEIDDPKPPKKRRGLSDFEEAGAPVEFVSTVEDHYRQMFISAELLHWNSSGNGNTAFKSVAWRRFWSWTLLATSSLFSNEFKFKLETSIKTLKNIVHEKQFETKEAIKIILPLNTSRKLLVSEVLKLVELIIQAPTTTVSS